MGQETGKLGAYVMTLQDLGKAATSLNLLVWLARRISEHLSLAFPGLSAGALPILCVGTSTIELITRLPSVPRVTCQ